MYVRARAAFNIKHRLISAPNVLHNSHLKDASIMRCSPKTVRTHVSHCTHCKRADRFLRYLSTQKMRLTADNFPRNGAVYGVVLGELVHRMNQKTINQICRAFCISVGMCRAHQAGDHAFLTPRRRSTRTNAAQCQRTHKQKPLPALEAFITLMCCMHANGLSRAHRGHARTYNSHDSFQI